MTSGDIQQNKQARNFSEISDVGEPQMNRFLRRSASICIMAEAN
jgi:hypothetical protein